MHKNITKIALKGKQEESMRSYRFQTVWWTLTVVDVIWVL
jgi:hypothetical protein